MGETTDSIRRDIDRERNQLEGNLEGIEANLRRPGLFEPTDQWNDPKLGFWQPDRRWDK